jgi:SAM-dependent methyltransferase
MPHDPPSDASDDEFNSPVTGRRLDRIFRVVGLTTGSRILDIGCGNGEALIRAYEEFGAGGVGVDLDAEAIRKANLKAASHTPGGAVAFHTIDATQFTTDERFDLVLCIGSSHACGGFRQSLQHRGHRRRAWPFAPLHRHQQRRGMGPLRGPILGHATEPRPRSHRRPRPNRTPRPNVPLARRLPSLGKTDHGIRAVPIPDVIA